MEETSLLSKAMGKREAILVKKKVSSLRMMGPTRRMVTAPLITWQFAPGLEGAHESEEGMQKEV